MIIHSPHNGEQWWRHATIYQVYPRSFASSGGPVGDLAGITSRLDHLARLGVDAVWLSPFYRSPQRDGGYDVSDHRDVDPVFGALADLDALIGRAHGLGLRVLVDLVPNHTSDEHAWFREALAAGNGSPARNRYIFREASAQPPNNWRSAFGGPAWTRVCDRPDAPGSPWAEDASWYLHLFDRSQPDLNWQNPEVHAEFRSILRHWLDRGVDGFRVDVAHGLVKDPDFPDASLPDDEPVWIVTDEPGRLPMFDQDGVHAIYREWNAVLAEYDGERAMVAEAWVDPLDRLALYIRPDEMMQAFNFNFLASQWDARVLREVIAESYRANDAVGATTTWVLSNHDVVRHASRFGLRFTGKGPNGIGAEDPQPDATLGLRRARAASLMMLGLAGSVYLYQGEELGLPEHTTLPDELRQDPTWLRSNHAERGRDGCRVPLPWEAGAPGFGFSPDGATWLPQPPEWAALAVDAQTGQPGSTLEMYRSALARRREWNLGLARITWDTELASDQVIAFLSDGAMGERPALRVITTFAAEVPIPAGWRLVLASGPVGRAVPADTTVWLTRQDQG